MAEQGGRDDGKDSLIAGVYLDFRRATIVLVKCVDRNVDGAVARLDLEAMCGIERAPDWTIGRVDADLVTDETLRGII